MVKSRMCVRIFYPGTWSRRPTFSSIRIITCWILKLHRSSVKIFRLIVSSYLMRLTISTMCVSIQWALRLVDPLWLVLIGHWSLWIPRFVVSGRWIKRSWRMSIYVLSMGYVSSICRGRLTWYWLILRCLMISLRKRSPVIFVKLSIL